MHTYTRASQQLITPTLTSNFGKLLHDLILSFALGDGPHKQTIVGNRDAHTDVFPRANFIVVTLQERLQSESKRPQVDRNKKTITYEFDGLLSSLFSAEGDEGVSSVQPAERVHHQTQIPYGSGFSNRGTSSSSKRSLGIFPTKIYERLRKQDQPQYTE